MKVQSVTELWIILILHSKNSGMNFVPIEYDFHPNEFHTYGMNSASMTFIPTAVRSSYRECEKTSVIPKLRVNFTPRCLRWQTALLGQRSSKSVDEKSIYAQKKIYSACKTKACSAAACMMQQWAQETSYACKSTTDEIFSVVNRVYLCTHLRGMIIVT